MNEHADGIDPTKITNHYALAAFAVSAVCGLAMALVTDPTTSIVAIVLVVWRAMDPPRGSDPADSEQG